MSILKAQRGNLASVVHPIYVKDNGSHVALLLLLEKERLRGSSLRRPSIFQTGNHHKKHVPMAIPMKLEDYWPVINSAPVNHVRPQYEKKRHGDTTISHNNQTVPYRTVRRPCWHRGAWPMVKLCQRKSMPDSFILSLRH